MITMFEDMAKSISGWLAGEGRDSMVVLSTRVRLARNVRDQIYPTAADTSTREKVVGFFESAFSRSEMLGKGKLYRSDELTPLDRDFLVERHLMSPNFMQDVSARSLFISPHEQVSVMVNEEDHLRIQALASGLEPEKAYKLAMKYDNEIGRFIEYDYDPDFGFLTACPTNVGTGMRASVLIHLPGLVITKDIDGVINKISKQGVAVRGFYGEGTDVLGNLFQISNQTTLGVSEKQILELIEQLTRFIIESENTARERLSSEASAQIEDKIWRAYGILKNARMLTSDEVMNLLSAVRLGIAMKIIDKVTIRQINEILLLSQPAHLQKFNNEELDGDQRDFLRAKMVREKIN